MAGGVVMVVTGLESSQYTGECFMQVTQVVLADHILASTEVLSFFSAGSLPSYSPLSVLYVYVYQNVLRCACLSHVCKSAYVV